MWMRERSLMQAVVQMVPRHYHRTLAAQAGCKTSSPACPNLREMNHETTGSGPCSQNQLGRLIYRDAAITKAWSIASRRAASSPSTPTHATAAAAQSR